MNKYPKSLRRYIRTEKARIRREALSDSEADEKIEELYSRLKKND